MSTNTIIYVLHHPYFAIYIYADLAIDISMYIC
jgi:hypothetical protein